MSIIINDLDFPPVGGEYTGTIHNDNGKVVFHVWDPLNMGADKEHDVYRSFEVVPASIDGAFINRADFLAKKRELYCAHCERRMGMKRGKMRFVYQIGDGPCRSCGIGDVLDDVEDFPAADAIEELQKELERWQAEAKDWYLAYMDLLPTRWISVEERLPEKDGEYLALSKRYATKGYRYDILNFAENLESVDEYDFDGQSRRGWYWYDDEYGYIEADRVTHWMPLPEPPREDGEK